uniref:PH domain-containing protein n=1 Tax=Timema douglasi TaxID=61478 RepID=A0A7R8VKH3_TIMDO|nr:unnamed protein product [Timema douglasi]
MYTPVSPRSKIVTLKSAHINIEPLPSTLSSEEDEDDDDDSFLPGTTEEGHASPTSMRLYLPKPRSTVQRRATVTGASPTGKRPPVNIEQFWEELRTERHLGDGLDGRKEKLYLLRDKSASFGNDLSESSFPRPKTCLGLDKTSTRLKSLKKQKLLRVNDNDDRKIKNGASTSEDQTQDKENVNLNNTTNKIDFEKSNEDKEYELLFNELTYHRLRNKEFEPFSPLDDYSHKASIDLVVLDGPISELCSTSTSIKNEGHLFANEAQLNLSTAEHNEKKECISSDSSKILNNSLFGSDAAETTQIFSSYAEKAKPILLKERGRLDKSYSTPAYDLTDHDDLTLKIKNINCLKEHVHLNVCDVEDQISASYTPQGNTIYVHTPLQNTDRDEISQLISSSKELLNVEQKINMNNGQIAEEEIDIDVKQTQRITEILETINTALVQHRLKEQAHIKQRGSHKHQENPISSTDVATAVSHCLHTVEVINNLDSEKNKIVLDIIGHEKQNTHILTSPFVHQELNDSFSNFEESPVFTNKLIATDLENSNNNNFISTGGFVKHNMNLTNSIEHSQKSLNILPPVKICITPPEPPPRSLPLLEPIKSNSTVTLAGIGQKAKSLYRSNGGKSSSAASLPSPRILRERTTLLAKKRNIAVSDLSNVDCEGWLLHRCRSSGTGAVWLKVWFILIGSTFYGFKTPHSPKADIMIGLSGFTASLAEEVKSRKFAFKIYHTGTVFYFAAETDDELTMWLDCIVLATLKQDFNKPSVGIDSDSRRASSKRREAIEEMKKKESEEANKSKTTLETVNKLKAKKRKLLQQAEEEASALKIEIDLEKKRLRYALRMLKDGYTKQPQLYIKEYHYSDT